MFSRPHDPISYISPERAQASISNMPVPLGMSMNMTHVPPRFYNQHQQALQGTGTLDMFSRPHDPISYISPERAQASISNIPVPLGMFMNMTHAPPRFYNQHQQALQGTGTLDMFSRPHDPISYISPERAQASISNMPVPLGMFMNMTHVPPRFYNQHQQALQGTGTLDMFSRPHDPISYISPERAQASISNMPVPLGMFMNMTHVPPRFYNQHQQALQGTGTLDMFSRPHDPISYISPERAQASISNIPVPLGMFMNMTHAPPRFYNQHQQALQGTGTLDMFSRPHDPISYISPERAQASISNMPVPLGMFMNMTHVPPRFYNQHQQALQGTGTLDMFSRPHDPISYISPERAQASISNMPVPLGMSMNMTHVPPRFYNQHHQALQTRQSMRGGCLGSGRMKGKGGNMKSKMNSLSQNNSQDVTQPYSQGITQAMSQGMSQPGLSLSQAGLSQAELSQDSYLVGEFPSQVDGLLSQDSTYQGGRSSFYTPPNPHFSQQPY